MSKNTIEVLNAKADVYNLQCMIRLLKRLFELPDNELTFDAYEVEGMLDQFDDMTERLDRIDAKLQELHDANPPFDVAVDGNKIVSILARIPGNPANTNNSTYSGNGNGTRNRNGNGTRNLQAVPDMTA